MSRRGRTELQRKTEEAGLLTVGQAAELLGVARDLLLRYIRAGQIPSVTLEHKGHEFTRMKPSDVDVLLQRMENRTGWRL